jgi:hypothetical protein
MKLHIASAALLFAAVTGSAWAAHCPADMKAIDEALSKKPSLTTAQLEEVTKLRSEGETDHKAGNHKGSVEKLGKARKILGI